MVRGNASIHRVVKVREALPNLRGQNLHLYYLPAYSPELNDSEHTFTATRTHDDVRHGTLALLAHCACARRYRHQDR